MACCDFKIKRFGDDDFSVTVAYIENDVLLKECNFMCSGSFLPGMLESVGMDIETVSEVCKKFRLN